MSAIMCCTVCDILRNKTARFDPKPPDSPHGSRSCTSVPKQTFRPLLVQRAAASVVVNEPISLLSFSTNRNRVKCQSIAKKEKET